MDVFFMFFASFEDIVYFPSTKIRYYFNISILLKKEFYIPGDEKYHR